jgi:hypothetical protein
MKEDAVKRRGVIRSEDCARVCAGSVVSGGSSVSKEHSLDSGQAFENIVGVVRKAVKQVEVRNEKEEMKDV